MRGSRLSLFILIPVALALTGCPTVDLGDTPPPAPTCRPDPSYYEDVIWPDYLSPTDTSRSCVDEPGCHRQADGRSALRLSTTEPIDHDQNYGVVTRFLNCGTPSASQLLSKPISSVEPHGGGDQFDVGSMTENIFLEWFNQ